MKLAQILVYWLVIAAAPHASGFDNIESWADELIEPAIASGRANGVSIGLVENGEVAFLKAYGWEDEDRQIPLDPHASVFRMCSISKSFIATAIMQLIEQGQIKSLDDPVNQYLKRLQLPPPHGGDVTLRQLMTHSAGMAGHAQPQGTTLDLPVPMSEAEVGQYFLESIETVPGTHSQYANLGVSLQGVVIEDVTGKELSAHLADSIFAPLGMSQSLLHYSMTTPERLAVPYGRFPNGELLAVPFYPKHPLGAASGGVMSTTADMLKYAAFHADETGVLYPDVLAGPLRAEMHRPHFRNSDAHDGVGLHFFPATFGNTRTASHGCGLPGTNSYLVVMPDINAALVISVLAGSNPPLLADLFDMWREQGRYDPAGEFYDLDLLGSGELYRAFAEEYLGEPQRPSITSDSFDPKAVTDVEEQVGTYWTERRSFTTPMVMLSMASVREVARSGDELEMGGKRFKALAPGIYEQTESGARIAFRRPWEGAPVF
ncbi:MAG: serine hydrolase domain-containing protein, partial [Pseudomonadota bacterium]